MPNLSIKDVPEEIAEVLRQRAARNHRSLQGELMALLEAAALQSAPAALDEPKAAAYVAAPAPMAPEGGDLLGELDGIVAGSQWGGGGVLTRERANDRRLSRELEYLGRQQDAQRTAGHEQ